MSSQANREGPHSSNCSSFVNRAYRVLIPTIPSWSPTTYYMVNEAYHGSDVVGVTYRAVANLLPGDLGFVSDVGHVAMHLAYGFVADHGSELSKVQKRDDCDFYPTQCCHELLRLIRRSPGFAPTSA